MFELALCTAGAAATLIAEHIALWRLPWRLGRPAGYVVGCSTVAIWWSAWCLWIGQPFMAAALWIILAGSGTPVIIAYWLRAVLDKKDEAAYTAGKYSRSPAPLTQETIDRGRYGSD